MKKLTRLPAHIAFIMDGNGRWAEQRGLSRLEGHQAGVETVRSVIGYLNRRHIKYVTLYGFSTENWTRPKDEVGALLRLLEGAIDKEALEYHQKNIKLRHLGRLAGLSPQLQQSIARAIKLTERNTGMTVGLAFNYGGRLEIIDAARRLITEGVPAQKLDEKLFSDYLYTAGLPDVDLVVRTGGEIRISNFLLWQSAYSEYYFTPVLWPDFNDAEIEKALLAYGQRQRRFGGLVSP
ncbi:MAG: di-trans,poly-cis-decaprenylcistransferase [Chloroflexi bacterium]|nr:di-trans,poly-cis-decaprenylcistransferase [Chloroflexota bacterium]